MIMPEGFPFGKEFSLFEMNLYCELNKIGIHTIPIIQNDGYCIAHLHGKEYRSSFNVRDRYVVEVATWQSQWPHIVGPEVQAVSTIVRMLISELIEHKQTTY